MPQVFSSGGTEIHIISIIIFSSIALILGILLGNAAVFVFNKMPISWLTEYGEEPCDELLSCLENRTQRIKSYPYKALFSMLFCAFGLWLAFYDIYLMFPALIALWALLEISISDVKYMIVPDQPVLLLAISATGFVRLHGSFLYPAIGAGLGVLFMLSIALIGKIFTGKSGVGMGDVKLIGALGLISGPAGTLFILINSSLLAGIIYAVKILLKRTKRGDYEAFAHIIAICAAIYILFGFRFSQHLPFSIFNITLPL